MMYRSKTIRVFCACLISIFCYKKIITVNQYSIKSQQLEKENYVTRNSSDIKQSLILHVNRESTSNHTTKTSKKYTSSTNPKANASREPNDVLPITFSDYPRKFDIVYTWLNSSVMAWRKANGIYHEEGMKHRDASSIFPVGVDLSDTFVELKYSLRGIEKYASDFVRNIYIVHSDLHSPPSYLNKSHPNLYFVPHSQIFPRGALPTFSRNSIGNNLHNVPGVLDWFMNCHDDHLLMKPFDLNDFFRDGKICTHLSYFDITNLKNGGRDGAIGYAARLLAKTFGPKKRGGHEHMPTFVWKPGMQEIEKKWKADINRTTYTKFQKNTDVHWETMYQNYMIDTGRGKHCKFKSAEIHTNGGEYCPKCDGFKRDISDKKLAKVEAWLKKSVNFHWINVQGPGFDDAWRFRKDENEREHSPKIQKLARKWFEETFPIPSQYEKRKDS